MRSSSRIKVAPTLAPWVGDTFRVLQSVFSPWRFQSFVCSILESTDDCHPEYFHMFFKAAILQYFLTSSREEIKLSDVMFIPLVIKHAMSSILAKQ